MLVNPFELPSISPSRANSEKDSTSRHRPLRLVLKAIARCVDWGSAWQGYSSQPSREFVRLSLLCPLSLPSRKRSCDAFLSYRNLLCVSEFSENPLSRRLSSPASKMLFFVVLRRNRRMPPQCCNTQFRYTRNWRKLSIDYKNNIRPA